MTPAISATGLTRKYYDQVALDGVHLVIGTATITGLLGRNGAGTTTLLRILGGQEFPSSGSVQVLLRPADGHPATLSALELTGVIAALTVVCLAGGHATIRRVTV